MKYKITIGNPSENIMLWQEQGYNGDVTIEVSEHQLDSILELLVRDNDCDVLVRAVRETEE